MTQTEPQQNPVAPPQTTAPPVLPMLPLDESQSLTPEQTRALLHELRVHQIELEAQNEELLRAQMELETTRAKYFDLYDLAPLGYCTLNERGLLVQANLSAANLLGMVRKALIMQPIVRFILKEDRGIYFQHHKALLENDEAQTCEIRLIKSDGNVVWAHMVSTLSWDTHGVAEQRVMLIDISYRKQMQAAVEAQNAELEDARHLAEKANRAKSDFLSSMSHELRTPLNSILGFAQLLEAGTPAPTPTQQARLGQILKAGWFLLELVNEVLDLAVIESGNVVMHLETLDLAELIQDCQVMVEPLAQTAGIRVTYPQTASHCGVHADRMHLKQVLINLLSNAIKYNRAGGWVEVNCIRDANQHVRLSVRDSGNGLTPDQLAQLFQPFNRLGQAAGPIKGTGIGLVVSKRLVELMGGEIGVNSKPGEGCVFWVDLGAAPAGALAQPQEAQAAVPAQTAPDQTPADANPDANPDGQPAKPMRLLLYVEDNQPNLQLMEEIISRRADVELLCAHDAKTGIALAHSHRPDVILMDINLPGMSGVQALATLRDHPATRHIPVVALSANAIPSDIDHGLRAGFFRYITKPLNIGKFMDVLDQALEHAATQRAAAAAQKEQK